MDSIEKHDIFEYLNALRTSGATNMFGSPAYVQEEFGLSQTASREIVAEWMKSFK